MSTPDDKQNKLIEIIRALFAKTTERGATDEESKSALAKAQELMTKYGIEQADVNAADIAAGKAQGYDFETEQFRTGRQKYETDRYISQILKQCFGVQIYWSRYWESNAKGVRKQRHTYCIIGTRMDIEVAKLVIVLLNTSMRAGFNRYCRDNSVTPNNHLRESYLSGMRTGYINDSDEGRKRAYAHATKDQANAYAVVLVAKADALAIHYQEITKGFKTAKNRCRAGHVSDAYAQGRTDGSKMNLGVEGRLT